MGFLCSPGLSHFSDQDSSSDADLLAYRLKTVTKMGASKVEELGLDIGRRGLQVGGCRDTEMWMGRTWALA